MNWKEMSINLGTINEKTRHEVKFYAKNDIPEIRNLRSSCGCTTPVYNTETKVLSVTYKAGSLPGHLNGKPQKFIKYIYVDYKNGDVDRLEINGTKI